MHELVLQGRVIKPKDTAAMTALLEINPGWSRRQLSLELCRQWDWRNGVGQLKDMAARTLLVKLEERGLIRLPLRRQIPSNRMRGRHIERLSWDQELVECPLADHWTTVSSGVMGQDSSSPA